MIRSVDRDLIVEGLQVGRDSAVANVAYAALSISQTLLALRKLKGRIKSSEGRDVRTVAVLLDGVPDKSAALLDVEETILEQWRTEADTAIRLGGLNSDSSLRESLSWVCGESDG